MTEKLEAKDVTIIIPIYCSTEQSVEWLKECLDSAAKQGAAISAFDDGSPIKIDGSIYPKGITYGYSYSNRGVSYARNMAIAAATTRLILPLDCDDSLADGAVSRLLEFWDGVTPVYPDVRKFGDVPSEHYTLLDFSCDNLTKYVGFASINVLHLKSQWAMIGGYDETIEFYEDGEYNARLLGTWCGRRCPEPLVNYRIHAGQRTDSYKARSAEFGKLILEKSRRLIMACKTCGGKRRTASLGGVSVTNPAAAPAGMQPESMPLTNADNYVLAQYVGGSGRGKHYYQGVASKIMYRVIYGVYLYVHPSDAKMPGESGSSMFVKYVSPIKQAAPAQQVQAAVAPVAKEAPKIVEPKRTPVQQVKRTPVLDDLPDIANMNVHEIMGLEGITQSMAGRLLKIEVNGKNRQKVVDHLQALMK